MGYMDGETGLRLNKTAYCGCGKCWVGMIRLSSVKETTDSPEKQESFIEEEAARCGGHIIDWAVDLDVSGATDPFTRKGFGPWLNDKKGPYDGVVASAVDRIGRSLLETLTTGYYLFEHGKAVITRGHGPWNLSNQSERQQFHFQALAADIELGQIKQRSADTREHQREIGKKTGRLCFPYYYVRSPLTLKVERIDIDTQLRDTLEDAADRLLAADEENVITPQSEARRLSRMGFLTPEDWRRVRRGHKPKGAAWSASSLLYILLNPATQGYFIVDGKAALGPDGKPLRIADPLWSYAKHDALIKKYGPKAKRHLAGPRAPRAGHQLLGLSWCGKCANRLYIAPGSKLKDGKRPYAYNCKARVKGLKGGENCDHGVYCDGAELEARAATWFLAELGHIPLLVQAFDPGTDATAQLAEAQKRLDRLQEDRDAGLYDAPERKAWFQKTYKELSQEISTLQAMPQRGSSIYWRPTGRTVADEWNAATTNEERRELMAAYGFRVDLYPKDDARRAAFACTDQRTVLEARMETWEAYQRDIQAEEEFYARVAAEQAAAEADSEQTADAFPIPSPAEQAAGLSDPEQPTRILELTT